MDRMSEMRPSLSSLLEAIQTILIKMLNLAQNISEIQLISFHQEEKIVFVKSPPIDNLMIIILNQ